MNYYLSLAALIPAVILFVRIYQLDRIEKEPHRLLGTLILCGALSALPAAGIQFFASRALAGALNRRSAVFLLLVWLAVDYRRFAVRLRLLRRLEQEHFVVSIPLETRL